MDKATATVALDLLGHARSLNPNWWRVSMALGELVLSHYERETPQGDLQPLPEVSLGFRQALGAFRAGTANELPAPTPPSAALRAWGGRPAGHRRGVFRPGYRPESRFDRRVSRSGRSVRLKARWTTNPTNLNRLGTTCTERKARRHTLA